MTAFRSLSVAFENRLRYAVQKEREDKMNKTDCQNERFSSRTVGIIFIALSLLLLTVGLVVLPVVGFIFAIPLMVLGIGMIAAPESKTCRLIMDSIRSK